MDNMSKFIVRVVEILSENEIKDVKASKALPGKPVIIIS